jgi:16S rRNA (guanine527-N7)-methyltransferase
MGRQPLSILTSKHIEGRLATRREALRTAGVEPDASLLRSVATYIELLLRWNRKINLTTITDVDEIVERNFGESFLGAGYLPSQAGRYCDVGSGAGFPGLALKLVQPAWKAILLEPVGKKAAFLSEVGHALGVKGLEVEIARWQDSQIQPGTLDVVMARALGGYEELVEWANGRVKPQGRLMLWLGGHDAKAIQALPGWKWQVQPLPSSRERVLLVGSRP